MIKRYLLLLPILLIGCGSKHQPKTIRIALAESGKSLKITGIAEDILQEINRDTVAGVWQTLIPVYRMPADTDLKDFQPSQPGKYVVNDKAVVFMPDTPFARHAMYFVRYYSYGEGNTSWDLIKQRKRIGKIPYTDLIFKP